MPILLKCIFLLRRIGRGVYVKPKLTDWGIVIIPPEIEIMNCFYIDNGEGYITGGSYLNSIGISTWVPAKKEVVTNKYRYKLDILRNTILMKPRIKVTADNSWHQNKSRNNVITKRNGDTVLLCSRMN